MSNNVFCTRYVCLCTEKVAIWELLKSKVKGTFELNRHYRYKRNLGLKFSFVLYVSHVITVLCIWTRIVIDDNFLSYLAHFV